MKGRADIGVFPWIDRGRVAIKGAGVGQPSVSTNDEKAWRGPRPKGAARLASFVKQEEVDVCAKALETGPSGLRIQMPGRRRSGGVDADPHDAGATRPTLEAGKEPVPVFQSCVGADGACPFKDPHPTSEVRQPPQPLIKIWKIKLRGGLPRLKRGESGLGDSRLRLQEDGRETRDRPPSRQ